MFCLINKSATQHKSNSQTLFKQRQNITLHHELRKQTTKRCQKSLCTYFKNMWLMCFRMYALSPRNFPYILWSTVLRKSLSRGSSLSKSSKSYIAKYKEKIIYYQQNIFESGNNSIHKVLRNCEQCKWAWLNLEPMLSTTAAFNEREFLRGVLGEIKADLEFPAFHTVFFHS